MSDHDHHDHLHAPETQDASSQALAEAMRSSFVVVKIAMVALVFVILGVTTKTANAATAGMVIGLTLTVVHLIGIPITGTSVNPARSLGPALIVGGSALSQVWLFLVAPLVGGAVAAGLHLALFPRAAASPADASEERAAA